MVALACLTGPVWAEDAKAAAGAAKDKKEAKKEKVFSPAFDDAPLADLLEWLTREAGLEYDLTKAAQKLSKSGLEKIRVIGKDLTAREIIDQALAQLGLSWAEKVPGQIKIMTAAEYAKDVVLELYDVRDLLVEVHDFAGPESEWIKKGEKGESMKVGKGERSEGGHSFQEPEVGEAERPKKPIEDPEKLKQLLRDGSGGDDAWGEGTSMDLINGILYVKAPWKLQLKVRKLLNQFHQFK